MLPYAPCNLRRTLSLPPWKRGLDWNTHMTIGGEKRVPFHAYVHSRSIDTMPLQQLDSDIWILNRLAPELRLHVLAMCLPDTLFRLMQVSSTLRKDASDLFWAKQNAYFTVEARWLLTGGYPGDTYIDVPFLVNVRKVEVGFQPVDGDSICLPSDEAVKIQYTFISEFWGTLQTRFPHLEEVVINYDGDVLPWKWQGQRPPLAVQLLLENCPNGIISSALVIDTKRFPNPNKSSRLPICVRKRWAFQRSATGAWNKSEPNNDREIILIPTKVFTGPVGQFMELRYQWDWKIPLQRYGLWPLLVEAVDRYYFDNGCNDPFPCLLPNCTAFFEQAGAWSIHAAEAHYREWEQLFDIIPGEGKVALVKRKHALDDRVKEVQQQFRQIMDQWNKDDGLHQQKVQCSWMEQLASDAAWETKETGQENRLWGDFLNYTDPNWVQV